ncbi:MAG: SDR family oxidoreductase [Hyphomonadaceae bacterium]|nr:SDR family oxidoreductase [Hyphomonadaceae bacterium]
MSRLEGKTALIIGASRGIGAATARALAERGARCNLAAPAPETCEPVAQAIRDSGGEARAFDCDVRDSAAVDKLAADAAGDAGSLDILVNCAGVMGPVAYVDACDPAAWAQCVNVNLIGAFHACRAVGARMRKQGGGVIVNMSSGAAFHALEGWSAYCCTKAGLAMLSKIVAAELADAGVRVFSFQPGMVNTDLGRQSMQIDINRVTKFDPSTFSDPSEPAHAIAWLCGEDAADLAGQEISLLDAVFRQRAGLAPRD